MYKRLICLSPKHIMRFVGRSTHRLEGQIQGHRPSTLWDSSYVQLEGRRPQGRAFDCVLSPTTAPVFGQNRGRYDSTSTQGGESGVGGVLSCGPGRVSRGPTSESFVRGWRPGLKSQDPRPGPLVLPSAGTSSQSHLRRGGVSTLLSRPEFSPSVEG